MFSSPGSNLNKIPNEARKKILFGFSLHRSGNTTFAGRSLPRPWTLAGQTDQILRLMDEVLTISDFTDRAERDFSASVHIPSYDGIPCFKQSNSFPEVQLGGGSGFSQTLIQIHIASSYTVPIEELA